VAVLEEGRSRIHVSRDTGSTWGFAREFGFVVEDVAWTLREDEPLLLMATSGGLFQLAIDEDADPVQLLVEPSNQSLPFYAIVATTEVKGEVTVAAAAQTSGGVYLSSDGGASATFRRIGLNGEDVRVLAVQYDGPRSYLWAGTAAPGGVQTGNGTFRRELLGREDPAQGWVPFREGWNAGSCWAISFAAGAVYAATQAAGVMRLELGAAQSKWQRSKVDSGLPMRDPGRFHPVRSVAANPAGTLLLASGPAGVFRAANVGSDAGAQPESGDAETRFTETSQAEFGEEVTLPATWLFACEENDIEVRPDAPD
jgi:hypothetical protein